jgi:hypothetical protein
LIEFWQIWQIENQTFMENARDAVIERLTRKGWITRSWIKDVHPGNPDQFEASIEWSAHGAAKVQTLHGLLDELELSGSGHVKDWGEQLAILAGLSQDCVDGA